MEIWYVAAHVVSKDNTKTDVHAILPLRATHLAIVYTKCPQGGQPGTNNNT